MSRLSQGLSVDAQKEFTGVRTRFQRVSDYRFFTGWVQDFFGERILVLSSPDVVLMTGEVFQFEVFGQEAIASFQARLEFGSDFGLYDPNTTKSEFEMRQRVMAAADIEFEFVITNPVTQRKAIEEARHLTQASKAMVCVDGNTTEGTIVDASESGMAIVLPEKLQVGRQSEIRLTTHLGEVHCNAIVRYSRVDKQFPNNFRTGFHIEFIDRIDRARWNRLQ
jgi:hypothetical protein